MRYEVEIMRKSIALHLLEIKSVRYVRYKVTITRKYIHNSDIQSRNCEK